MYQMYKFKIYGFSLISAVFILVILSLVASFLVNLLITSRSGSDILLLGERAEFAAKSGLEWGLTTVALNPAGPCPATTNFNISQGGLLGYNVIVSCVKSGTTFTITSVASKGNFGNFGYVTRTVVGTYG